MLSRGLGSLGSKAWFRTAEHQSSLEKGGGALCEPTSGPPTHPRILRNAQRTFLLFTATNGILCLKVSGKSQDRNSRSPSPSPGMSWRETLGPVEGEPPRRQRGAALFALARPQLLPGAPQQPRPHTHSFTSPCLGEPGARNRAAVAPLH